MPPTEQALALVVRGTDWSETSRIATYLALFLAFFGTLKVNGSQKGHTSDALKESNGTI